MTESGAQGILPILFQYYLKPFSNLRSTTIFVILNEHKNEQDILTTWDIHLLLKKKEGIEMSPHDIDYNLGQLEKAKLIRKCDRRKPISNHYKDSYTYNTWKILEPSKQIYRQIIKPASMGNLALVEIDPKTTLKAYYPLDRENIRELLRAYLHIEKLVKLLSTLKALGFRKTRAWILRMFTDIPTKEIESILDEYSDPTLLDLHFIEREEKIGLRATVLRAFGRRSWHDAKKVMYSLTSRGHKYAESLAKEYETPLNKQIKTVKMMGGVYGLFMLLGIATFTLSSPNSELSATLFMSIALSAAFVGLIGFLGYTVVAASVISVYWRRLLDRLGV